MKLIVAGGSGQAGKHIVQQCLQDDRVTKVFLLTRKPFPKEVEENSKVEVVMHDDFSTYPDELMKKFEGAEGCIWAIGGRVDQFNNDPVLARKVGQEYTLAFASAVHSTLAPKTKATTGKPFRFVFCSGMLAEWNQDKTLYFLSDTRKIKGAVEKGLCELEKKTDEDGTADMEVRILRPSGFVEPDAGVATKAMSKVFMGVDLTQLGRAFVQVACEGSKKQIIENGDILKMKTGSG